MRWSVESSLQSISSSSNSLFFQKRKKCSVLSPREGRLWNFGGTHKIHKRFLTDRTGCLTHIRDAAHSDSNSNVILTHHTCGQRPSMAAGIKHQALAFLSQFSFRQICLVILISNCREECDLPLCTLRSTSVHFPGTCKGNATAQESTGTWPDYLANRADQKNEWPFVETVLTEIEKCLLAER